MFPELDLEIQNEALVHSWEDRLRVAHFYNACIRVREGELKKVQSKNLDEMEIPLAAAERKRMRELMEEINNLKGQWKFLLGTEFPALFAVN